jgi:hypothetical protein
MNFKPILFAGMFVLPLQQQDQWQVLEYSNLPANRVEFDARGMSVSVNRSASPIIYPLPDSRPVRAVEVRGELSKLLNLEGKTQGQAAADDFSLKIGLVLAGEKTLNFFQRLASPSWVKTLYALAPQGSGIDHILFLNAVQDEQLFGDQRQHPLSSLIYERNVWLIDRSGPFELSYELEVPRDVVAVWISIDGDDSGSEFSVQIRKLVLTTD